MGRAVERPVKPTSIELSHNDTELKDPKAYPVKVHHSDASGISVHIFTCNQVHLKRLSGADGQPSTEVVNARFVVGTDG